MTPSLNFLTTALLTLSLHKLLAEHGDQREEEAEEIRDTLDGLWNLLDEEERDRCRDLSVDCAIAFDMEVVEVVRDEWSTFKITSPFNARRPCAEFDAKLHLMEASEIWRQVHPSLSVAFSQASRRMGLAHTSFEMIGPCNHCMDGHLDGNECIYCLGSGRDDLD